MAATYIHHLGVREKKKAPQGIATLPRHGSAGVSGGSYIGSAPATSTQGRARASGWPSAKILKNFDWDRMQLGLLLRL